jgi:ABC-type lipoprotein release transport system permease subunit
MSAVWLRLRADLRLRAGALIALGIMTGVAGGVVIVAVAGARRTDTTLARYVRASRQPDVLVNPDELDLTDPAALARWGRIDRLPDVVASAELRGVVVVPLTTDGQPDDRYFGQMLATTPDGRMLRDVGRAHLVDGRLPDPANAHEIVVNRKLARDFHLHVGSRLRIWAPTAAERDHPDGARPGRVVPVVVTGVVLPLDDAVRPIDDPRLSGAMLFTKAFARLPDIAPIYAGKYVRLRHGVADLPAFEAAVQRLIGENVNFQETRLTEARAARAVRPFVVTLWAFAALVALVGGVIVAQTLSRQHRLDGRDHDVLRALGWSRRELVQLALLRGAFIGVVGAATALVTAWAASSIMPIGPLRVLEPSPGRTIDTVVFVAGGALVVALVMAHAASVVIAREPGNPARVRSDVPSRLPAPIGTGVRLALDRGRGTLPVRSTLVGVCIAVAALVASLVYGAALQHFTTTPRLYGWVWDYQVELSGREQAKPVADALRATPGVRAFTLGEYAQLDLGSSSVAAIAVQPRHGVPTVETVDGRAPARADEVALGAETMRALHTHIGATVTAHGARGDRTLRVVGRAVFARFAPYSGSEPTGLGVGAVVTVDALTNLTASGAGNGNHFYLVTERPGAHLDAATLRTRLARVATADDPVDVWSAQRPNDVLSYERLERTPLVLAGLLVALGAATLTHLLVTGLRRRRRDLGLLKAIGCTMRQVVTIIQVQATTLVVLALLVAVPAGVVAGRAAWVLTARWLGVPARPVVPLTVVAGIVLAVVFVANLVAFWPGRNASRERPALALRTE